MQGSHVPGAALRSKARDGFRLSISSLDPCMADHESACVKRRTGRLRSLNPAVFSLAAGGEFVREFLDSLPDAVDVAAVLGVVEVGGAGRAAASVHGGSRRAAWH